jgi:pSer/pThr/pTyr-binding forkhead associated (FHA) protein
MANPSVVSAYPMAMLVPQHPYEHLRSVYAGRVLTLIGTGPEAHIKLRSRTISRRHAILLNVDGRITIRDLGSRTLVYVNGKHARQAELHDGDMISMGRITFKLVAGDAVSVPPVPPAPPAQIWLKDGSVARFSGPIFVIGRRRGVDLLIRGEHVARAHAMILEVAGRRFLLQLSSRSPILLNDNAVKEALILPGDSIKLAGHQFQYELGPEAAAVPVEPISAPPVAEVSEPQTSPEEEWSTASLISLPPNPPWEPAPLQASELPFYTLDSFVVEQPTEQAAVHTENREEPPGATSTVPEIPTLGPAYLTTDEFDDTLPQLRSPTPEQRPDAPPRAEIDPQLDGEGACVTDVSEVVEEPSGPQIDRAEESAASDALVNATQVVHAAPLCEPELHTPISEVSATRAASSPPVQDFATPESATPSVDIAHAPRFSLNDDDDLKAGELSVLGEPVAAEPAPEPVTPPDWLQRCGPLAQAMASRQSPAPSSAKPVPAPRRKSRRRILIAAVLLTSIVAAGAWFALDFYGHH